MFEEILKKLLQHEVLSEELKTELSEQFKSIEAAYVAEVREEVESKIRVEFSDQWLTERDILVEKIDTLVTEVLTKEIDTLRGDIERFRDLEADYAEKLIEERHRIAEEVSNELDDLVDKLDAFFEVRLSEEIENLKEDIEITRQNEFGRKIFDAFQSEFSDYVDDNAIQSKLAVTESKLQDVEYQLASLEEERNQMIRESKMQQILSPLMGKKREQMEMVLKNVDTNRLDESYKFFIGRILKEDEPLNENTTPLRTVLKTGTNQEELQESSPSVKNQQLMDMKRLAGIK